MIDRPTGTMTSPTLNPILSENGTSVTLTLQEGGQQLGCVIFETPEFAAFLDEMAVLRAKMVEPVSQEIDVGARVQAIVNPKWSVKLPSVASVPSVVLALRHPGHGWIANLFSTTEAKKLASRLLSVAQGQISAAEDTA